MTKREFKKKLVEACGGCSIQHKGWPCGSCFFCIDDSFTNADWQSVLFYRGGYDKNELDNLPDNYKENLKRIYKIIGGEK